jgi:hypothetical protein
MQNQQRKKPRLSQAEIKALHKQDRWFEWFDATARELPRVTVQLPIEIVAYILSIASNRIMAKAAKQVVRWYFPPQWTMWVMTNFALVNRGTAAHMRPLLEKLRQQLVDNKNKELFYSFFFLPTKGRLTLTFAGLG